MKPGLDQFSRVCPHCDKSLEIHSIEELVNCGLMILNSDKCRRFEVTCLDSVATSNLQSKGLDENVS